MNILGAWRFDARTVADALDAVGRLWGEEDHLLDIDTLIGVIEELMVNAVEHSGEGGGVVTLLRVGDTMTLRVEDSGVGIHHNKAAASEEMSVARAFQPGPEGTSSGSGFRDGGLVLTVVGTTQIPGRRSVCSRGRPAMWPRTAPDTSTAGAATSIKESW